MAVFVERVVPLDLEGPAVLIVLVDRVELAVLVVVAVPADLDGPAVLAVLPPRVAPLVLRVLVAPALRVAAVFALP